MSDDRQDVAESLDADKVDDADYAREQEGGIGDYPPDRPLAAMDYGVTDREQAVDEPITERAERWEPDPLVEALDAEADERP